MRKIFKFIIVVYCLFAVAYLILENKNVVFAADEDFEVEPVGQIAQEAEHSEATVKKESYFREQVVNVRQGYYVPSESYYGYGNDSFHGCGNSSVLWEKVRWCMTRCRLLSQDPSSCTCNIRTVCPNEEDYFCLEGQCIHKIVK